MCFPQGYLIGWDEFRKNKWLISYTVVISISIIDWVLSLSMVCDEVRTCCLAALQGIDPTAECSLYNRVHPCQTQTY